MILKMLDPDPIIADPYARSASLKDLSGSTNSMLAFRSIPSGSIVDEDPGSGAFLTPGSGKNNPDHNFENLETNFLG
jgi:hypothetical protein